MSHLLVVGCGETRVADSEREQNRTSRDPAEDSRLVRLGGRRQPRL
jgi:hypothetical protein